MEYKSHIAWRSQIPGIALVILLIVLSGVISSTEIEYRGWSWLPTVLVAAAIVVKHFYYTFRIQDGRIERQKGIVARDVHSVRVKDLKNTNLNQGFIGRILNFGDLDFSTSGGGGVEVRFHAISKPKRLKEEVEGNIDQA